VERPWDIPKPIVKNFENKLLEKIYILEVNLQRRQLNDMQRILLTLKKKEIIDELARQKHSLTFPKKGQKGFQPMPAKYFVNIKDAKKSLSNEAGVSIRTLEKAQKIFAEGSEELKNRVLDGKTSISHAYTKVKRQEKHRKPKPIPEGEWAVILADPPWPYDFPLRGAPDAHYPRMTREEILEMKFPSAEDAVLFLWATNPQLEFAIEVMNSKGFSYRTNMVWAKDIFGTGYYFRGQHELLLLGIKGGMPPPIEEVRFPSVLMSPRRKHSEKPEEVYEIIETMYPNQKYIELFARPTSRRKDWSYWGLEA